MGNIKTAEELLVVFHFVRHRLKAYVISSEFSFSIEFFWILQNDVLKSSRTLFISVDTWKNAANLEKNICKIIENKLAILTYKL